MSIVEKFLDKAWNVSKRVCEFAIILQGIILTFMAIYICADVFARKIFSFSVKGSIELSGYSMAVMSGWIFSYALITKSHVRIDILYTNFSTKLKVFVDFLAYISLLVFFTPLTYYSFRFFKTSLIRQSVANTPLHTPLWIPQSIWIVGLIFFVWIILLSILKMAILVYQGELIEAHKLGGITTVEEEIEKEKGVG